VSPIAAPSRPHAEPQSVEFRTVRGNKVTFGVTAREKSGNAIRGTKRATCSVDRDENAGQRRTGKTGG
jgi:hypothetical protein